MTKQLNILFIPFPVVGRVNGSVGVAEVLIAAGHSVTFAVNHHWLGRLTKYGIREVLLDDTDTLSTETSSRDFIKSFSQQLVKSQIVSSLSPLEKVRTKGKMYQDRVDKVLRLDRHIEKMLIDLKPDCVILDQFVAIPSVVLSGIPFVNSNSVAPLSMWDDPRTPPPSSGN